MADFSITLTVDDTRVNDLLAALRNKYGPANDGTPEAPVYRDKTPAELRADLKAEIQTMLKKDYRQYLSSMSNLDDVGIS